MQTTLWGVTPDPRLADYDTVLVNSSAGKDSQAMLDLVAEMATAEGVLDRLVVVHCDLGRVEWPGTRELAETQARHYGLRFEVVSRPQGDLLDHIESRGMFPDANNRYCTGQHKTQQVYKLMTALKDEAALDRPVRILNCLGLRAQESKKRAGQAPFSFDERASTQTTRHVWEWLPIHSWTIDQVWHRIRKSGVPYHPAYDEGMPRLSCSFCIFASKSALIRAAQLRPDLAAEYVGVEQRINHTFKKALSMAEIVAAAERETVAEIDGWAA